LRVFAFGNLSLYDFDLSDIVAESKYLK